MLNKLPSPLSNWEMKVAISIFVLIILGACAPVTPLEELEQQALVTGDWSAVELRERVMRTQQGGDLPKCPEDELRVCIDEGVVEHCMCYRKY